MHLKELPREKQLPFVKIEPLIDELAKRIENLNDSFFASPSKLENFSDAYRR